MIALNSHQADSDGVEFARDEWRALLEATYALAKDLLQVSHPDRLREAARKPVQMVVAKELGLRVPRTLITNDAKRAREFFQICDGKIVCKPTGYGGRIRKTVKASNMS